MSFDRDDVIQQLSALTIGELVELKRRLEHAWGVRAAAVDVVAPIDPPPPPPPPPDPTEVRVVLTSTGANKIAVIRVVREVTGLGLVAARDLVDGAPTEVRGGVSKTEADEIMRKLVDAGAQVEVK